VGALENSDGEEKKRMVRPCRKTCMKKKSQKRGADRVAGREGLGWGKLEGERGFVVRAKPP